MANCCRYYPSCSQYTYEAVETWGFWRGIYMGTKRILRCNPYSNGGFDPVPKCKPTHNFDHYSHHNPLEETCSSHSNQPQTSTQNQCYSE